MGHMGEPQGHCATRKESHTKDHTSHDSTYMSRKELQRQNINDGYLGPEGEYGMTANGNERSFRGDGNALKLTVVMVAQCGRFTKNSLNCTRKWVNFIA